jgi:hypothetical protein
MSDRLLPYRSLARQETEVSAQIMVAVLGGLATQRYAPEFALFGALVAFFAANLLYSFWTNIAGFERVTSGEQHRRHTLERAQRPIWVQAVNEGAIIGALIVVCGLFGLVPDHYHALPLIVAGAFLAGAFLGLYLAIDARRSVEGTPCQRLSFAESTGRHLAGYAMGLAGALAAATFIDNPSLAIATMLAAFLSTKFAVDMLLAAGVPPCIETEAPIKWYHFLIAFPAGAIWWGIPFGVLGVLVTLAVAPDASSTLLFSVFSGALLTTGFMAAFATVMAVLMGLYPRRG